MFAFLLIQTNLQLMEKDSFSHNGRSVSIEDESGRQLEQFKNSEWEVGGRRKRLFAFTPLLLPMHEAWYQAASANPSNASQWHLGNWLGKSFAAIKKLKDFLMLRSVFFFSRESRHPHCLPRFFSAPHSKMFVQVILVITFKRMSLWLH